MMVRSCVLALVIASMAGTAHLCGAPTTTGTLEQPEVEAAEQAERERERKERTELHQKKIQSIIEQHRKAVERYRAEKRGRPARSDEESSPVNPFADEQDESGASADDPASLKVRGDGSYVVRVAAGLGKADAEKLKAQLADDVPAGFIQVERGSGLGDRPGNADRDLSVVVGPFRTKARALSVYRLLTERGYRFDTLPGWGSVVEKRGGAAQEAAREHGPETVRPDRPAAAPPQASRPAVVRPRPVVRVQGVSRVVGGQLLPELFTSSTAAALTERKTPASVEDLLVRREADSGRKVQMAFSGAPLERVLDSLSRQTGIPFLARGLAASEPVSLIVRDADPAEAMRQVLGALGMGGIYFAPSLEEGTVELWDLETFRREVLPGLAERRVFDVREVSVSDASRAVSAVLTRGLGHVVELHSNTMLVVTDLPWVLRDVEALLGQIDRKAAVAGPPRRETAY